MKSKWMQTTLLIAGIYNIIWGSYTVLFPTHFFNLISIPIPHYIEFWQCIGMIVGVYGIGYIAAASDPLKHWPIILVGLLGKVFGPIGFIQAILTKGFPLAFGATILTNDLIWWFPFGFILYKAYQRHSKGPLIKISEQNILDFDDRKRARFINSLSGFKSANLLGSVDHLGQENLSIISSAFHLGANPALLGFIIRPDVAPRHTLENLRQTKFCTLNHVHHSFIEKAHQTSARYEKDQSEFSHVGLHSEYKSDFQAPYVKESKIKFGLELLSEEVLINKTHFIIAKIKDVYLPEDCLSCDGIIDIEKAGTAAISGLDCYHTTTKKIRLSYAKVGQRLSEIF